MEGEHRPHANSLSGRSTRSSRAAERQGQRGGGAPCRRSSREFHVDMAAILPALESKNNSLDDVDLTGGEMLTSERPVRSRPMTGGGGGGVSVSSCQSMVNSIHDHPLMEAMEAETYGTSSADVSSGNDDSADSGGGRSRPTRRPSTSSIGSMDGVEKMLSESNKKRLSKAMSTRAFGYKSAKSGSGSDSRTSRTLKSSNKTSSSSGPRISGRRSTREPSARRRSSTRPLDSYDDSSTSSSGGFPETTRQVTNLSGRRPTPTRQESSSSLERQLIRLKIDLANAKASDETLQLQANVLTEENCMLRTQLCAAKTSEANMEQTVASLQKEIASLKAKRNWSSVRDETFKAPKGSRPVRRGSGLNAMAKAVESLLSSEIEVANDESYGAPLSTPLQDQPESLASRFRRSLSNVSLDNLPLNDELIAQHEESQPRRRGPRRRSSAASIGSIDEPTQNNEEPTPSRRAARRRSSLASVDDAVEVQCELNNLAQDNDDLREKNEALAAERDRLRERLDQIMSLQVSTVPLSNKSAEYQRHGADYDDAPQGFNESPSSIRDFMTKVTSIRNLGSTSTYAAASGPKAKDRSMSNPQASILSSQFTQHVDSLLWDSFNEDEDGRSCSRDNVRFSSVPSVAEENGEPRRRLSHQNSSGPSGEDDDEDSVDADYRLCLDDYEGPSSGSLHHQRSAPTRRNGLAA